MSEKKLAALVGVSGPPSEPAARVTCQPLSASAPVSARATCAEPPRGKKNSAEQTRPATAPVGRAGRAPFSPAPRSPIPLRFGRGAGDSSPEPRNGRDKPNEAPAGGEAADGSQAGERQVPQRARIDAEPGAG